MRTVGKLAFIISLNFISIFSTTDVFGQGYQIDTEAGKDTVNELTTDGLSLVELLSRMTHKAITGGVDTFYPGEVNPVLVVVLSVIATAIGVMTIALAWGSRISKLVMIVVLTLVVMFMVYPIFNVPAPVSQ